MIARVLRIALTVAVGTIGAGCTAKGLPDDTKASGNPYTSEEMPDGKEWTNNLSVNTIESYCYEDAELTCRRYGRLYTWQAAQRACESLGSDWRLPTDNDWRTMAGHYGGVDEDSKDSGKSAYRALVIGGTSAFRAILGGGRQADGQYARLGAHGFYWTSSASSPTSAWFYNFGKGSLALYRQGEGDKQMALSVRCVRESTRQ